MDQDEWENLASVLSVGIAGIAAVMLWLELCPPKVLIWIQSWITRLASRSWICFTLIPILSLGISLAITARNGIPNPIIHDEFSYLLAADTFAHGRLTNPTPPFYQQFETPHELMRPTYMSKYPPGQGIALAIGQVLTGKPIVGVWLSTAAACVAIYWMLLGFVSPPWALLGGLGAVIHPLLVDWSRAYWQSSVAVIGGALLLGAWGRLMQAASNRSATILGLGLLLLANTRPYEGLMFSLVPITSLGVQMWRNRFRRVLRCFASLLIVLLSGSLVMGYYNLRNTGHALRMPFIEYARQYDVYPKFWFLPKRPTPVYSNPSMRFVHADFELGNYDLMRSPFGFLQVVLDRCTRFFQSNLAEAVLLLPLGVAVYYSRESRIKWALLALMMMLPTIFAETFYMPHYTAPALPLFFLLVIVGLERIWHSKDLRVGPLLARAIAVGFVIAALAADAQPVFVDRLDVEQQRFINHEPRLATGRHLVFVEYAPMYSFHHEFVYNRADLDESRIIWARSFGADSDRQISRRFPGRQIWHLYAGGKLDLQQYRPDSH